MLLAACGSKSDQAGKRGQGGPAQVGFVVVQPGPVPVETTLSGRVSAFRTAEVRPQVSGVILRRLFTEGAVVRQGQPLYQIDPSLYRASADQASANLASANATAQAAQVRAARYKPLAAAQAVAQQDYTDAVAQAGQARAAVAQNRAALSTAQINLRFTTVPAPISGRIGRSLLTEGALATTNQTDPLAVISTLDTVFVDIQQSSAEMLALRRTLAGGGALPSGAAVRLKLEDGSTYGFTGTIQFSEVTVSEATGTVALRAKFPNPQGTLMPGMFVQAVFEQAIEPSAYLVPQQALQRDLGGGAFVYVVGQGNKVETRTITTSRTYKANWVVTAGLKPGDRIITQGTANLKRGTAVRPVAASAPQRVAPRPAGAGGQGAGASKRPAGASGG
ncbi:MAG: efflux transporter periplasmic adaptor subunit [Novosphingobium sp.]|nr:efflux transporter periplasmic adaptor subunit [Novosphingobium sp.]